MDRITDFLDRLPGYSGYRDLESRRDSDRRLRESIASQLEALAQRVERGGASLVASQRYSDASAVEQLVRSLNHAANLVRTQSYGYGGIFTDTPVDDRVLHQLFLFDKGLGLKVDQLDRQLAGIEAAITNSNDLGATLSSADTLVRGLVDSLSARGAVIETAAPAPVRSLFTPMDDAAKEPAPAPIAIALGDAIGWFDEDFLVDAIVEVHDESGRVRFFHIDEKPDRWLAIADRDEQIIALLDEQPGSSDSLGSVAWNMPGSGTTERAGEKPLKASAWVTFYTGEGESVAFRLLSGTDERYLSGKRVHPDDLSVYGKPAK
ncbi:MAG: hypothetical protein KF883_03635 [Thermomicrobiales bacterium]|nr:hypothetical protein [Thermomicrobiales bacterium]